jgi:hypothetical protein
VSQKAGFPRYRIAMTPLSQVLHQALGSRTVAEGARLCGVPYWILRDVLHGEVKRPDAAYLQAFSRGFGIPFETLALAAYSNGAAANGDTPPTPPESESPCPPKRGRSFGKDTGSTS